MPPSLVSSYANRRTGHVTLPGIYPHTYGRAVNSAGANTHRSQQESGSSEKDVILLFSYQVLHLTEPAAGEKG